MSTKTTSPFLDTREAAEYLRLRPRTLERWRWAGGGPRFHKFGRRVVYSRQELEDYARTTRRSSTSDAAGPY